MEIRQVKLDPWTQRRGDCSGAGAFIFAKFRENLAAARDRNPAASKDVGNVFLVDRIYKTEQEAHRRVMNAAREKLVRDAAHFLFADGKEHVAARVNPFTEREAIPTRHDWRRSLDVQIVKRRSVLPADQQQVAEAFGGDKRTAFEFPRNQRVRCEP